MEDNNSIIIGNIIINLEECSEVLGKIYSTCCMPSRSAKMDDAFHAVQVSIKCANNIQNDASLHDKLIEDISVFGGKIGKLFATCCTDIREPLYKEIYEKLQNAHRGVWKLKGHDH